MVVTLRPHQRGQPLHQVSIVRAATGDDHLARIGIAPDRERDGSRGQLRRGGNIDARLAHELRAILFPAAGFGRLATVIRIIQQPIQQRGIHLARAGALAIAIERRRHGIHHHVARPGVERDHVFRFLHWPESP